MLSKYSSVNTYTTILPTPVVNSNRPYQESTGYIRKVAVQSILFDLYANGKSQLVFKCPAIL